MRIRTARTEDLPALRDIERAAGECFRDIGMAEIADDEPPPLETLTTFTEVPWNAPYHERCGFRPLSDAELTGGLREILARESAYGLDRRPRVCMRRETTPGPRRKE